MPYSVWVINQAVPRQHRRDMFSFIRKNYVEYFDGRDIQKDCDAMAKKAEDFAENIEERFI